MEGLLSWDSFKTFATNNNLQIMYRDSIYYESNLNIDDTIYSYGLETVYNGVKFYCEIVKDNNQDHIDFDTYYKDSAIKMI